MKWYKLEVLDREEWAYNVREWYSDDGVSWYYTGNDRYFNDLDSAMRYKIRKEEE